MSVLTFWEMKVLLDSLICSLIATILGYLFKFCDYIINTIIIWIIFILEKRKDTETWNNIHKNIT